MNSPGRTQGENFMQILSRTNSGSLNPDFASRHQNGRKTNILCGQAHGEQNSRWTKTIKRHVVGGFCRGRHQGDVNSALRPQLLHHLVRCGIQRPGGSKSLCQSELFFADVNCGDMGSEFSADLNS